MKGSDQVMTEAQLPPGMDAPSPKPVRDRIASGAKASADVEGELRRIADRVGGWPQLRDIVDRLAEKR
ncbi:MAG TPA: hypothetical protein VN641_15555 [Urbifossiella sp.]|jgi:hypothetical protein|nr:hypothetical protein [Urbifossiella sp.]